MSYLSDALNLSISKKYPSSLVHFVTNRCNARCSFCFIDFDDPNTFKGELTIDEINKLSLTFGPNLNNLNLTGGEPFARKDFSDITDIYLKNTSVKSIFITSNGSLPDRIKKFVNYLSPKYPDKEIIFSLSIDAYPEVHNKIRKIEGLFDKVLESYNFLKSYKKNVMANIAITVTHENYEIASELYNYLKIKHKIKTFTSTLVRDEGIYKTPKDLRKKILSSYDNLTNLISNDIKQNITDGYNKKKLIGRMLNKKNEVMNKSITKMYMNNDYISPCHASSLFGVITADGWVHSCEILNNRISNLRDKNYNFLEIWHGDENKKEKEKILNNKCRCTYECAWTFNILGNFRYYPSLMTSMFF